MLPTSIDYATTYAAMARLGAIATGLNPRLGAREVAAIFERAEPKLAVVDDGPLARGLPRRHDRAPPPRPRRRRVRPARSRSRRHPGARRRSGRDHLDERDDGLPKGAWFDHDNLRAAVDSAGVMTAPFDRRLVTTPFAHAGYMAKLWEQLAWATTLVICPTPWSADDMVRLIGAEGITVAGGAPTQWAKVLEQPALAGTDVSRLRLCVAATAPAPPELVERVTRELGCPLVVRYAMTESPSITGTEPGDDPRCCSAPSGGRRTASSWRCATRR